jgi:ferrous iron transport protein A
VRNMRSAVQPTATLATLRPGQMGTISAVHADDALHRRLAALGIRVGKPVYVIRSARFGGPLHVRIGTTDLIMRRKEAEKIDVHGISG